MITLKMTSYLVAREGHVLTALDDRLQVDMRIFAYLGLAREHDLYVYAIAHSELLRGDDELAV
jgi:hypothetical protein